MRVFSLFTNGQPPPTHTHTYFLLWSVVLDTLDTRDFTVDPVREESINQLMDLFLVSHVEPEEQQILLQLRQSYPVV